MKNFFKSRLKAITNLLLLVLVLVAVSLAFLFILESFDIISHEDGLKFNTELFISFKGTWYGWLVIILVQIVATTLLCFIPGVALAFLVLIDALYPIKWQAFIVSFIAVMSSSLIMYLVGKYGGYKICEKILGEKDCKKAADLLKHKTTVYFPIMMMFPMFPDDALVMLAGTFKMSLVWFIPSIVIGRGIGICTYVFGFGNIPFDKFTSPWHWVLFIVACIVVVGGLFFGAHKINQHLEKKRIASEARQIAENAEAEQN